MHGPLLLSQFPQTKQDHSKHLRLPQVQMLFAEYLLAF